MRKGVSISMNTLVIALIALIVLILMVAIFSGRMGTFTNSVSSCQDKGGRCTTGPCYDYETIMLGGQCEDGDRCCMRVVDGS